MNMSVTFIMLFSDEAFDKRKTGSESSGAEENVTEEEKRSIQGYLNHYNGSSGQRTTLY